MAQFTSNRDDSNSPESNPPDDGDQGGQRSSRDGGQGRGRNAANGNISRNFAAATLRGMGQLFDVQMATARALFLSQFHVAAAFGLPDYSRMFAVSDDRSLRLLSATIDNAVSFADQLEEIRIQIQTHIGRLFERQAIDFTERLQGGLDELREQTGKSLMQFQALSRQQVEDMARASDTLAATTRSTLRESGEQMRATLRDGAEQGRAAAERQTDAVNEAGQRVGEVIRGSRRRSNSAEDRDSRSSE